MTRIKEKAVEMIQRMPDDDMFYVINILQNLEELTARKDTEREQAMAAFQDILKYRGRLPEDFDADKELAEAKIMVALDNDKFIDFEDCLQEQCAVEEVADYIVTRNPDDFIESRVKVIQPDELVSLF